METRPTQQSLYEVITNTIYIDNVIDEVISMYFGVYEFNPKDDSSSSLILEPLDMFQRFFLQDMGHYSKLKIIKDICKKCIRDFKFPVKFEEKFRRFYLIRNIFAHSIYPKHVEGKNLPNKFPSSANWEDLHTEHSETFRELNDFLAKTVYDAVFETSF